jgi:hypothetical protein
MKQFKDVIEEAKNRESYHDYIARRIKEDNSVEERKSTVPELMQVNIDGEGGVTVKAKDEKEALKIALKKLKIQPRFANDKKFMAKVQIMPAESVEVDESSASWAKSLQDIAKKKQLDKISDKDKALLIKLADMMKNANEAYRDVQEKALVEAVKSTDSMDKYKGRDQLVVNKYLKQKFKKRIKDFLDEPYFDGRDYVCKDKTIVRKALGNPEMKVSDLEAALDKCL